MKMNTVALSQAPGYVAFGFCIDRFPILRKAVTIKLKKEHTRLLI